MLERCVTDDAVLVDTTGRWEGVPALAERIGRYQSAAPDTEVVTDSGVDATLHAGRFPPAHSLSNAPKRADQGRPVGRTRWYAA